MAAAFLAALLSGLGEELVLEDECVHAVPMSVMTASAARARGRRAGTNEEYRVSPAT